MCDTTSHVPPPRELVGEQQGGAEEDGQTDPSLKEMFQEGMSTIAIHRKENVFQDLDKRTLTEEEQAVIQRRVEHQRKMYELFEKKERERKIQELKEVCPDISDEEASRALELCQGDEEQAATRLVSDSGFRRHVMDPDSREQRGSSSRQTRSNAKKSDHWHAKPDGQRPKVVDRASLEGTIFVGAFRGKGFQGKNGRKVVMRKLQNTRNENNENEAREAEDASDVTPDHRTTSGAGEEAVPLSQNGETPVSVPKVYALVKEDSEGNIQELTQSELKQVQTIPDSDPGKTDCLSGEASAEQTVKEEAPPSATRRSSRQRTVRAVDPEIDPKTDGYLEKVACANDKDAAAILGKLSKKMVAYILESLGTVNPEKAVSIREILDSSDKEPVPIAAHGDEQDCKVVSQACSSEATLSDHDGISATLRSSKRRQCSSVYRANSSADDGDVVSGSRQTKKTLRKKSSPDTGEGLIKSAIDKGTASSVISARGHTNRGRVKQKSHKSAELLEVGTLRAQKGWYNAGYIFPEGFKSRTLFRSSVAIDSLCVHECDVIGRGGTFWPAPTFRVVALDRPDEPLIAKSCTGCWTAVLKRINAEIEARRAAGEDLPPPPRTAIAGPEYFGFNQPDIVVAVEALDPNQECFEYWTGKAVRQQAAAGLPAPANASKSSRRQSRSITERFTKSKRQRGGRVARQQDRDSALESGDEEDDEARFMSSKWSSVSRTERYRNRLQENGDEEAALKVDSDNPLPDFMDPITLEPVIRPAISPYGHVMGAATWKAVLAEQGVCPFTKKPLKWEQCRMLTKANIDIYKDSIIQ
ncbi:hypothetical protein M9434_005659 [Picochlorum sp. BPE23]|nr:hypothetical protein M9434_005659 [Picochlorum sp. BPE23]